MKRRSAVGRSTGRENRAQRQQRTLEIVAMLARAYGRAECALIHANPFQLLVATILSAQCTDERVNSVTPRLFARFPDAVSLAHATQADVEEIIKSLGFFRAKATNLRGMAQKLWNDHQGQVPRTLEELTALPGVGRKTANVVLGTAFNIPSGVVVDTHVRRISNLLGLTTSQNPEKIEQDLMALIPKQEWVNFSHRLIHHGRRICIARRPKCADCPLLPQCPGATPQSVETTAMNSPSANPPSTHKRSQRSRRHKQ